MQGRQRRGFAARPAFLDDLLLSRRIAHHQRATIQALPTHPHHPRPYGILDWRLRLTPIGRRQMSPVHISTPPRDFISSIAYNIAWQKYRVGLAGSQQGGSFRIRRSFPFFRFLEGENYVYLFPVGASGYRNWAFAWRHWGLRFSPPPSLSADSTYDLGGGQ